MIFLLQKFVGNIRFFDNGLFCNSKSLKLLKVTVKLKLKILNCTKINKLNDMFKVN